MVSKFYFIHVKIGFMKKKNINITGDYKLLNGIVYVGYIINWKLIYFNTPTAAEGQ